MARRRAGDAERDPARRYGYFLLTEECLPAEFAGPLSNEAVGDERRIYTRYEIIEAERQGRLLE